MSELQNLKDEYLTDLSPEQMVYSERLVYNMTEDEFAQMLAISPNSIHPLIQGLEQARVERIKKQQMGQ